MTALHAVHSLEELAATINECHERVVKAGREMIEYAIRCGEALLEARDQVPNGMWLAWVADNVSVHIWTAHRYMRLAQYREEILASDVRYIEDAMRLLAEKPRLGHGPRALSIEDKKAIADNYHEHGMAATMQAYGVAKSTIWRLVSDRSPDKFDPDAPELPPAVTDEVIEQLARWLVEHFGGGSPEDYPVRVVDQVRQDAEAALVAAFGVPDESGLPPEEKIARAKALYESGEDLKRIARRLGVASNTVLRWCDEERAERARAGARRYKDENRARIRAQGRERARRKVEQKEAEPAAEPTVTTESPFSKAMFKAGR